MKQAFLSTLLAGALCLSLTGCNFFGGGENNGENGGNNGGNNGNNNATVTVTENTDPVSLKGEKVDRTEWTNAFGTTENYSVKSAIKMTLTENEDTMTANVTLIYRITADKMSISMTYKEGDQTAQAEAYAEIKGDTVTLWDRTKEGGDWSEWDGEEYSKTEVSQMFDLGGNLGFAKEQYANFSYSDADKGYTATASGLTSMKEALDKFAEGLLAQLPDVDAEIAKVVLKLVGGKPGALLMDMTIGTSGQASPAQEGSQEQDGAPGQEEDGGTPGQSGGTPGQEEDGGTPGQSGTPGQEEDGGTPGQGGGTPGQGGSEEPSQSGTVSLTQVYFDYGKTAITRPAGLPEAGQESGSPKTKKLL